MSAYYEWHYHAERIMELCEEILSDTKGMDQESFASDRSVYGSTLECIRLIGRGVEEFPSGVFRFYPQVDWRGIMAVCYTLEWSGGFLRVNSDFFWQVVKETIPLLLFTLPKVLGRASDDGLYKPGWGFRGNYSWGA